MDDAAQRRAALWVVSLREGAPSSECIYHPCPHSRVAICPCLPGTALVYLFIYFKILFIYLQLHWVCIASGAFL